MKTIYIIYILSTTISFAQLNESKKVIDSRFISTDINSKLVDEFREEIKLSNISLDTIKVYYDENNIARIIKVFNIKNGFNDDNFNLMNTHLNTKSNPRNLKKSERIDYLYDEKKKSLVIKIFETNDKKKLIEIQFISDEKSIKKILSQV